jgi:hypothetical protein
MNVEITPFVSKRAADVLQVLEDKGLEFKGGKKSSSIRASDLTPKQLTGLRNALRNTAGVRLVG